jgi:hypothetical protein
MPGKAGTLEILAQQIGLALQPLETLLAPENVTVLFADLGLLFPPQLLQPSFVSSLTAGSKAAGALTATLNQLATQIKNDNVPGIVQAGAQLVQEIQTVISSFPQIGTALGSLAGALPRMNPAEVTSFANKLSDKLISHSLISHLEIAQPGMLGIANLFGVVAYRPNFGNPEDPTHPAFIDRTLQLSNLTAALTSPAALLKSQYHWGGPGFDGTLLMPTLSASLNLLDVNSELDSPAPPHGLDSGLLSIRAVPSPLGLLAQLHYDLPSGLDVILPLSTLWSLRVQVQGAFGAGLEASITAPSKFSLKPPSGTLTGLLQLDLVTAGADPDHPVIMIGAAGGSRIQAGKIAIGAGLPVKWDATLASASAEPAVTMALTGGKAVIDISQADSFIGTILNRSPLEVDFELGLTYTIGEGLKFSGSTELAIQLLSHLTLGPIEVTSLTLSIGIKDGRFPFLITADIKTALGPLTALVGGLGFRINVELTPDNKGNLGPINIDSPHFQTPNRIGLDVDAGGFRGGGFLDLNPDKGEYAGILELTFAEVISVRAVGILSTRLPDGKDTFSLLLIIVSEFVPIQLSYGFTLLGVGGLLGLNRTVDLDALQVGVRDGTLNSILFPADVVANAPRIISDLKRVFPPREDRFLMGPMGKLGWGTPTLISVEIGLLLEIPRPAFAIIGVLRVQLPAEEFGTIYIQVNFSGSVDFEKGQLQFDASLYNSRILIDPITGDMALRIYWGGDPNFLLTVGGFHPAYTPPPMNIGALQRVGFVLVAGIPMVRAEVYLAITSNSVQFGAHVEVLYGVSFFNVFGFVDLDVLIQFNPFMFIAEISAMVGVRSGTDVLFGIRISGTLKGPTPWNVRGEASFEIGFIIKVRLNANFEITAGEARNTLLPAIDVLGAIRKAIDNVGNWRAVLPNGANQHVSLRELGPTGALVLHPFGALEINQKVAPLNIALQRFGSSRPERGSIFKLAPVQINKAVVVTSSTTEQFAPAQFFELSDAEKLSRPAFARYESGLLVGADDAPQTDFCRARDAQYEVIYLPERQPVSIFFKLFATLFNAFGLGNAAAQSPLSKQVQAPSAVAAEHVRLAEEQYAVVSTHDLTLHAAPLIFASATAAHQAMATLVGAQPKLTGAIQVVPSTQIRRAA